MIAILVLAVSKTVQRWRDIGPVLWLGAAGALAVWLAVLGAIAAKTEPRRVKPGPPTFELAGGETPAVVNLVTADWELGREALPATLLDLAARGFLTIDWIGERTLVRVREHTSADPAKLADYERMVLDHLRMLSRQTSDGFVPAEALTTGPAVSAKNWWRRFEDGVAHDARRLGLSRARFSAAARTVLTTLALVVGFAVMVAATTLTDSEESKKDEVPFGAAVGFGIVSAGALIAVTQRMRGERDTAAGRVQAARWLGLREMLHDDPAFSAQPPAAVAVWERMLAHGAALGAAPTAVQMLPFGAEDDHTAWSSVGNRWRVVKVRYPRLVPPGYGRHPLANFFLGLFFAGIAAVIAPGAVSAAKALLDAIGDSSTNGGAPAGVRIAISVVLSVILVVATLLAAYGLGLFLVGFTDLVRGRRTVEGRALRVRVRGSEQKRFCYVAVDDGSATRVRAWRLPPSTVVAQGSTVRGRVSRTARHVADFAFVTAGAAATTPTQPMSTPTPLPPAAGPPPPLPGASVIAAAFGSAAHDDPGHARHPMAIADAVRAYTTDSGARVMVAWVQPQMLEAFRRTGSIMGKPIHGLGDEAYRPRLAGGIIARTGPNVLIVTVHAPGLADGQREQAADAIARTTLDHARPT